MEAVDSAAPTPGAAEFLVACRKTGRLVAIVSNNSAEAVRHYLARHELADLVAHVEGRHPERPDHMKPSPWLVLQATAHVGGARADTLMIGDSVTDLEAARPSGTRSVGYASAMRKHEPLHGAGADAVVTSMAQLAATVPVSRLIVPNRPDGPATRCATWGRGSASAVEQYQSIVTVPEEPRPILEVVGRVALLVLPA